MENGEDGLRAAEPQATELAASSFASGASGGSESSRPRRPSDRLREKLSIRALDVKTKFPPQSLRNDASIKGEEKKAAARPEEIRIHGDEPTPPTSSQQMGDKESKGKEAAVAVTDAAAIASASQDKNNEVAGVADSEYHRDQPDEAADPVLPPVVLLRPGIVAVPGPGVSEGEDGQATHQPVRPAPEEDHAPIQAYAVSDEAFQSEAHDIVRQMMDDAVVVEAEEVVKPSDDKKKSRRKAAAALTILAIAVVVVIMVALGATGKFSGKGGGEVEQTQTQKQMKPSCDDSKNCLVPRGPAISRPAAELQEVWDTFGNEVSLSKDGLRLAVSAEMCNVRLDSNNSVVCHLEGEGTTEAGAVWVFDIKEDGSVDGPIGEFHGIKKDKTLGFLSGDGNRVAITARFRARANGTEGGDEIKNAGYASFYQYSGVPGNWTKLGSSVYGEAPYDRTGKEVALSHDGNIVAVGSPGKGTGQNGTVRAYQYDESASEWKQIGSSLVGDTVNDFFGWSIALSKNGKILAVGVKGEAGGYIRSFEFVKDDWVQLGEDISASLPKDERLGRQVELSADGMILASSGHTSGEIRVFEYKDEDWKQVGNNIGVIGFGNATNDRLRQVSISADGKQLATGADSGHVRAYLYNKDGGNWTQVGGTLLRNDKVKDYFGESISMSGDAKRLVVGAPSNKKEGVNKEWDPKNGYVRIYDLEVQ